MFDRILWGLGIAIVIFICITSIRAMTGWSPAAPNYGDVFTFGSILVVAIIAYVGWRKTDERQQKKNNREAAVQAIILYRGLLPTIQLALKILDLSQRTIEGFADETNSLEFEKEKFQEIIQILPEIQKDLDFNKATLLLRDSFSTGQSYIKVVEHSRHLKTACQLFLDGVEKSDAITDKVRIDFDHTYFMHLAANAIFTLHEIERLRSRLKHSSIAWAGEITALNVERWMVPAAQNIAGISEDTPASGASNEAIYKSALWDIWYLFEESICDIYGLNDENLDIGKE